MTARPLLATLCALVLVFVAACSTSESGTLTPGGSETSGTETEQPDPSDPADPDAGGSPSLAPPVPDPLDSELLLSEPCDLLTSSQRGDLDLTEGESRVDETGNDECQWRTTDNDTSISISAEETFDEGLDDVYTRRSGATYFEPTEINGHPAVFTASAGTPEDGNCQLYLGVTDELVTKLVTLSPMSSDDDPCEFAQEGGKAMIDTLQG